MAPLHSAPPAHNAPRCEQRESGRSVAVCSVEDDWSVGMTASVTS